MVSDYAKSFRCGLTLYYNFRFSPPPLAVFAPPRSYAEGFSRPARQSVKKPLIGPLLLVKAANCLCFLQTTAQNAKRVLTWARKSVICAPSTDSSVVQSVERRTVNPYVTGSSPVRGAKFREARSGKPERAFCFLADVAASCHPAPLLSPCCFMSPCAEVVVTPPLNATLRRDCRPAA